MPGFGGEVAEFYHRYRRGYPPAVFDAVAGAFALTTTDVVLDLGCGTGQLTVPMAARVRAAVGVDPEPDMLAVARRTAAEVPNVAWVLGADTDVPALAALFGGGVGAVTVGQALHWMDDEALFRAVRPLLRPGGGVAVVTNGTPLWLQDNAWSRAVAGCLEEWFGTRPSRTCGTDPESQQRYADRLAAAGFDVTTTTVEYADDLDLDQLVGGLYSAFSVQLLPAPERRPDFAEQVRRAVHPRTTVREEVRVSIITGRLGNFPVTGHDLDR